MTVISLDDYRKSKEDKYATIEDLTIGKFYYFPSLDISTQLLAIVEDSVISKPFAILESSYNEIIPVDIEELSKLPVVELTVHEYLMEVPP